MKLSHHKKLETKKLSNIEKITPVIWEYNSCIILQQFWLNCSHFVIQKRHKITIGNFQIFSSLLSIFLVKHKKLKFVFLTFAQETICEKEIWIFFCTLNQYIGLIPKIIINKIQNVLKIMLTSPKLSECISAIYTQFLFNNAHNQFFIQNSFCKFNNPNVFFFLLTFFWAINCVFLNTRLQSRYSIFFGWTFEGFDLTIDGKMWVWRAIFLNRIFMSFYLKLFAKY